MDSACVWTGGTGRLVTAQNKQQSSGLMKSIGILLLISVRTEFQPKNLHLPVRWGRGYSSTLDTHSWSAIPNTLLFPAFSSHRILHSSVQRTEPSSTRISNWAGSLHFAFWPKHPRNPLLLQVGSEEEHSYSVADEKASPLRPALPAMLPTLQSHTTTSWIAARCIPLHFVMLPWPILCQKWLALTVLWWIKELLQLWNRAEFSIHVKSLFLFWRNVFNAACNSPSVLFSYFCEDKGKIQAD